ncbi:Fibrinogen C-terminal domain-containing protein [Aphelenchoides besseyi]|nr:Fibrinogen C-terminal domain-containing protein [Aphelenchoides besseyi]
MRSYDTLDARPNPYEKDPVLAAEQRLKKRRSKRFWFIGCAVLFAILVGIYLGWFFLVRSDPPVSESSVSDSRIIDPTVSNLLVFEPAIYETCEAYRLQGYSESKVYALQLPKDNRFDVFCEMSATESWTRMQLRVDESVEFWNRTIEEYRNGFGPLDGNHWLGLEKVRAFIDAGYQLRLRIQVDGNRCEKMNRNLTFMGDYKFWIGKSSDHFHLNAFRLWSNFSEPFVLINENGGNFSTSNCEHKRLGGFWYVNDGRLTCTYFSPNGEYTCADRDREFGASLRSRRVILNKRFHSHWLKFRSVRMLLYVSKPSG